MRFELNQELIDQIIFAMENQEIRHFLDSREAKVVAEQDTHPDDDAQEAAGEERYLPLPEWVSVDGYMLMESFVSGLRNPLYRENLRQILQSGRGVFRQFKDALKERKDIERLWFRHKQREMRRRVIEWYNDLREIWGLAPLSIDDEAETEDLLLADFTFELIGANPVELQKTGSADSNEEQTDGLTLFVPWSMELELEIREWDRQIWEEANRDKPEDERGVLWVIRSRKLPREKEIGGTVVCVARTPANERAGFLWAVEESGLVATIVQLAVISEYRGLGMGSALLHMYQKNAGERGIRRILFEVPERAGFIKPGLAREGYVAFSETLELEF